MKSDSQGGSWAVLQGPGGGGGDSDGKNLER